MSALIYDISVVDNVFIATDQNGDRRAQFHNILDIYKYEPNVTLGTPANIKIVEKYGDSIELDVLNVGSISGVPFVGDFDALVTAVNAFVDAMNSPPIVATIPGVSTESKQDTQIVELNSINSELDAIKLQLDKKPQVITIFNDLTNPSSGFWAGFPVQVDTLAITGTTAENSGNFGTTNVNNIDEFILLFNNNLNSWVISKKSPTEFWIESGTADPVGFVGEIEFIAGFIPHTKYSSANFQQATKGDDLISNLDCILEKVCSIDDRMAATELNKQNDIFHEETTNPAALVYSDFKKLSFVADGTITVTVDGNAIVYPYTMTWGVVPGTDFEADVLSTKAVTFNGTGTVLVTIQK
jgi:hypothetical protein